MCISYRDASNVVVAFSWDHSDEVKFQQTFRLGKKIMPRFLDLQSICGMLGYQRYGLGSLSEQVMGWRMNKSFKACHQHTHIAARPESS